MKKPGDWGQEGTKPSQDFKPFQGSVESRPFQGTPTSFPSSNSCSQVSGKLYSNSSCDQDLFTPPRLHKSSNCSSALTGDLDLLQSKDNSDLGGFQSNLAPIRLLWLPGSMTKEDTQDPRNLCSPKCYFGTNQQQRTNIPAAPGCLPQQLGLLEGARTLFLQTQDFIRMPEAAHDWDSSWSGNVATLSSYKKKLLQYHLSPSLLR